VTTAFGVGDFDGDKAFPLRLKGRNVHDDAATGIGRFAETNCENIPWYPKIFDCAGQSKGVGGNGTNFALELNKRAGVKIFGVNHGTVDVCKDFELIRNTNIVTIG
jgi:hypothetical protein